LTEYDQQSPLPGTIMSKHNKKKKKKKKKKKTKKGDFSIACPAANHASPML
jgi:hypothetical protein